MKIAFCFFFGLFFSSLNGVLQDAITLQVGVKTLVFNNPENERILITEVYYPSENGEEGIETTTDIFDRFKEAKDAPILKSNRKYPLIVVSHGQRGDRFSLAWLCDILAAHGFIVAAVDHFESTWSNTNPGEAIKRWNRADDTSFLINAIFKDPVLSPHLNQDKIGMIGYSLGSLTGIWLAGGIATKYHAPSLKEGSTIELEEGLTQEDINHLDISLAKKSHFDARIKAFVLLSPVYGSAFDKAGLNSIRAPVLLIAAENDKTAPLSENALLFYEWIPTASLLKIGKGAGHTIFLNKPARQDAISLEDQRGLQKTIVKEVLKFFDQTL